MSSKKRLRANEKKSKRQKQTLRRSLLLLVMLVFVGFLVFFFLTIYDIVYPPVGGKQSAAKKEKVEVTLFFSDANERFLVPERRFIAKETDPRLLTTSLVAALIDGSKTGLVRTLPEHVSLRGVKVNGGVAYVDFARNFVERHPGGSAAEMATIYSLTHTLTENIPEVKGVKILVEGKEINSIKGHIDTRRVFKPEKELVLERSKEG
ncbi:MAG TPA: GerMN domain-containing protein [Syntrophales bacterium]|nr:GerMN domain-containing protein [Syntrophales bacterium]HOL59263.1 GerMN domain-containing protein [Syntrophales bacterium]HPO35313.1 GerMN domain-containing protein [Syntrophales bacterium]